MKISSKSKTSSKSQAEEVCERDNLRAMFHKYLQWMKAKNYTAATLRNRNYYLKCFLKWGEEQGITRLSEVTQELIARYYRHLSHLYSKRCQGILSEAGRHRLLKSVYLWCKWLVKKNYVLFNPAGDLEFIKRPRQLPHHVLTANEVECVLTQADLKRPRGIRDRAIMETLYSTGMRRHELINLKLEDIDIERGTVFISQGKGRKDRIVPIGERALRWLDKYLREVRPKQARGRRDEGALFITKYGKPFSSSDCLTSLLGRYVKAAHLGKAGACHIFRHAMATLMLENGADIRYIKEILGHECLNTTEIYTKVSISKLKEVHRRTHPTAQ